MIINSSIEIIIPKTNKELENARRLGHEYINVMCKNPILARYLQNQNYQDEIDKMPFGYEFPDGVYLLAYGNKEEPAGIVALRRLDHSICEMKRLYVSPKFQGFGLGRTLVERLIIEAKQLGYSKMRLDNSRSAMAKANSLYAAIGFYEIEPYNENFVDDAYFMEKIL
jgi:GNAT superfamily N-acetyltransferase